MSVHVREATFDNAPELLKFARRLFSEAPKGIFNLDPNTLTLEDEERYLARHIEPANSCFLLAFDGDKIVGTATMRGREHPQEAHIGYVGLAVDKEYRGQGVGTTLLKAIVDDAPTLGIKRLEIEAFSNNPEAQRLYERMGFEVEGVRRAAVLYRDAYIDSIEMSMILPGLPIDFSQRSKL